MQAEKICIFTEPINDIELELWFIPATMLKVSSYQRKFSKPLMHKIARSIAKGFFTPLLVILEDDTWQIVDGQHRWGAIINVKGNVSIPCIRIPERFKDYALIYNVEKSDDIKDRCRKVYEMYSNFVLDYPERPENFIAEYIPEPHLLSLSFAHMENGVTTLSLVETCIKKFDFFLDTKMQIAISTRQHRGTLVAMLIEAIKDAALSAGVTDYFVKQSIMGKTNKALWEGKRQVDVPFDEGMEKSIAHIQDTDWGFLNNFK